MELKDHVYKVLFEAIQEGLMIVNQKGVIVDINTMGKKMFGYTGKEVIGKGIDMFVPDRVKQIHKEYRGSYAAHPTTRTLGSKLKFDGRRKDGSEFPVQVSLNPFKSGTGEDFVIVIVTDVTERRESELKLKQFRHSLKNEVIERTKKLQESEQLYKSIARNFPSGIISIFDKQYRYLFAEGQDLREKGVHASSLIGTNYLKRFDSKSRKQVNEELDEVFEGIPKTFEVHVSSQTYSINAVPLYNEKNDVDRILVVEKNVTDERAVAEKMRTALMKERELTEMKSRFVSMASHEFRTPLSTINSSATLIERYHKKGIHDKIEKHVERIKNSVQNLTAILNDFLSFEKLEDGKINVHFEKCNVSDLIKETFEEMEDITKDNQRLTFEGKEDVVIFSDGQLIRNTMRNILSNAIKYSSEGDEIIVSLVEEQGKVKIAIEDQGVGIPLKDQKNLFTRFFRAGNVANIEGTGLGLNIVQRYLDLLQGEIDFISEEAKGTTFFITLPNN